MVRKKRLLEEKSALSEEPEGKTQKEKKKPAEGSRLAALWLLLITVVLGAVFYVWGAVGGKGIEFQLFKTSNRWEYQK